MAQGRFHHRLGSRMPVLLKELLFQGASIDTDADRYETRGSGLHHLGDLPALADVAGVDAQPVDSHFKGLEGKPVIEMDIRDQRDRRTSLDIAERLRSLHVQNRAAHQFAARRDKTRDLCRGGGHVAGIGAAHGLDRTGSPAADGNAADPYLFGRFFHNGT